MRGVATPTPHTSCIPSCTPLLRAILYHISVLPFDAGRRAPLYLKALEAGGKLLVHWVGGGGAAAAAGAEAEAAGSPPAASPQVLELAVDEFAGEAAEAPPGCYKNVDKLVGLLRCATAVWGCGGVLRRGLVLRHGDCASWQCTHSLHGRCAAAGNAWEM